jgi:hypothetical protein
MHLSLSIIHFFLPTLSSWMPCAALPRVQRAACGLVARALSSGGAGGLQRRRCELPRLACSLPPTTAGAECVRGGCPLLRPPWTRELPPRHARGDAGGRGGASSLGDTREAHSSGGRHGGARPLAARASSRGDAMCELPRCARSQPGRCWRGCAQRHCDAGEVDGLASAPASHRRG